MLALILLEANTLNLTIYLGDVDFGEICFLPCLFLTWVFNFVTLMFVEIHSDHIPLLHVSYPAFISSCSRGHTSVFAKTNCFHAFGPFLTCELSSWEHYGNE